MENIVEDYVNSEFVSHGQIQQTIYRQSKLSFKGIEDHYENFCVYKFGREKNLRQAE